MNDWTDKCSRCKYAHCPAPEACYCDMEREAREEVRASMRMLAGVIAFCMVTTCVLLAVFFFL